MLSKLSVSLVTCLIYPVLILAMLRIHYEILWQAPWILIFSMVLFPLLWQKLWQVALSNVLAFVAVPPIWNLMSAHVVKSAEDLGIVSLVVGLNARALKWILFIATLQALIVLLVGVFKNLRSNRSTVQTR